MANELKPGKKNYDGKTYGKDFYLIERSQSFAAEIFNASAVAPKEYRFTICKIVQTYACEIIYSIRIANSYKLGSKEREDAHQESLSLIDKLNDLLPVIRKCRCISIRQEADLCKKLGNLRIGYIKWIESDRARLKQSNKDNNNNSV